MNETECRARIQQEVLAMHYKETGELRVPVNVSNRHVHLDEEALFALFGKGHQLTHQKDLIQIGQYACKETVTIRGPKGAIEKVRVLGPLRKESQVEISMTDSFKLGVKPVICMSGHLEGTPGITIEGPAGTITLQRGVMVAMRHLHVPASLSETLGLSNNDTVSIITKGNRPSVLMQVVVRVSDKFLLEAHVDLDEANGCGIKNDMLCSVIKEGQAK